MKILKRFKIPRKCQAIAKSSGIQCTRNARLERYCWQHYPRRDPIILGIVTFLLGFSLNFIIDKFLESPVEKNLSEIQSDIIDLEETISNTENQNQPQLRVEQEKIQFKLKDFNIIIPVKNYGFGIAEAITIDFSSKQMKLSQLQRIQDLPPGATYQFQFYPSVSELAYDYYSNLYENIKLGEKALVFKYSGSYEWNGKKYPIREQTGVYLDGKIQTYLSDELSLSNEIDSK